MFISNENCVNDSCHCSISEDKVTPLFEKSLPDFPVNIAWDGKFVCAALMSQYVMLTIGMYYALQFMHNNELGVALRLVISLGLQGGRGRPPAGFRDLGKSYTSNLPYR
jgi:hypothetical protein